MHASSRKRLVTKLRCSVCKKYKERIAGRRNFSEHWIVGADSVRTSNIRDHSHTDQHIHAMSLLKREQAKASNSACCSYSSPIVHALSKLPDLEKAQLRVTFDLANFIAMVVSDQMLRMANHILDWLDILSYQFSRLIFNSIWYCTAYCTVLYYTVLYCVLYCTVLNYTVLYCVLYCTVLYGTVLRIVLYCTIR